MCESCGCGLPEDAKHAHEGHGHHGSPHREEAALYRSLLEANEEQARENREHLLEHHVLAVNLMSGPGSGKTSLIEALARLTAGQWRIGVIEGDLATDRDAARVRALGLPVHQVTTGSTCHLDAAMVHGALHALPLEGLDLLVVENVGNLVCPGLYDLGCHLNGVLLSVTEGDDKVAKYPVAFRRAQFFCITKTDLLPHVEFDVERPKREARLLKGDLKVFTCSSRDNGSLAGFAAYLEAERKALLG
jgi:hydrogenase nickel incorporation protein HypB